MRDGILREAQSLLERVEVGATVPTPPAFLQVNAQLF